METKMASIYGFSLKNRKTFQGLDWQGNQGNLYYKGKKVARYNDCGNGSSCDIVFYDNSCAPILEETIKRYFKERPIITEYGELDGDEDVFMAELLQLMDNEKEYKKAVKKGYSCLVTYTDANTHFSYSMMCNENTAEKMKNRTDITGLKIYRSEKDFIIE